MTKMTTTEFSKTIDKILKAASDGLSQEEQDLKDYIKLVLSIAKPYVRTRVEYEDLVMAGVEGLLLARRDYDPERSDNFKNYAQMRIMGRIYSYCQSNIRLISVPTHIAKASSYVEKIYKLANSDGNGSMDKSEVDELVLKYESELESKLTESTRVKIRYAKDRIKSIAKNSSLQYDVLARLAKDSLVSTVSDTVLASKPASSLSIEEAVSKKELQQTLVESLGTKRFRILQLHTEGYSNPEIAKIIHDEGYTETVISRAALKNLLDNAIAAVKNMEIFSSET